MDACKVVIPVRCANECDKFKDFRYGITEELEEIICDVETNVNTAFMKCKCFSKKLFRNLIKRS